jgi:hypothetical protein
MPMLGSLVRTKGLYVKSVQVTLLGLWDGGEEFLNTLLKIKNI